MFDALKNLSNLPALLGKAREMQQKMKQVQDELARKHVSADAGAGAVTADVNGRLEVVRIRIDREKLDVNDIEMLEELVVAAIAAAQSKAGEMIKEEMSKAAGDMGLPPGMMPPP